MYQIHVRGFTQDRSSGVVYPGTYSGVIEKIPHLQRMGFNAVELMPIQDFNEARSKRSALAFRAGALCCAHGGAAPPFPIALALRPVLNAHPVLLLSSFRSASTSHRSTRPPAASTATSGVSPPWGTWRRWRASAPTRTTTAAAGWCGR